MGFDFMGFCQIGNNDYQEWHEIKMRLSRPRIPNPILYLLYLVQYVKPNTRGRT